MEVSMFGLVRCGVTWRQIDVFGYWAREGFGVRRGGAIGVACFLLRFRVSIVGGGLGLFSVYRSRILRWWGFQGLEVTLHRCSPPCSSCAFVGDMRVRFSIWWVRVSWIRSGCGDVRGCMRVRADSWKGMWGVGGDSTVFIGSIHPSRVFWCWRAGGPARLVVNGVCT